MSFVLLVGLLLALPGRIHGESEAGRTSALGVACIRQFEMAELKFSSKALLCLMSHNRGPIDEASNELEYVRNVTMNKIDQFDRTSDALRRLDLAQEICEGASVIKYKAESLVC